MAVIAVLAVLVSLVVADSLMRLRWHHARISSDIKRHSALADLFLKRDEILASDLVLPRGWSGFRKFRITQVVQEAKNVMSFHLTPNDGQSVTAYLPGQFLTIRFKDETAKAPLVRCYSLSQAHAPDREYRITVKLLAPPEDAPESTPWGRASSWLHSRVGVGSVIEVAPPAGNFTLALAAGRPIVLIAGGIGITPYLPMLEYLEAQDSEREVWLFHAVRYPEDQIMGDQLAHYAEKSAINVISCFSGTAIEEDSLNINEEYGWITIDFLRSYLPSSNYEFYICGPPTMMSDFVRGLQDWGVPSSSIHFETFSSESVQQVGFAELPDNESATHEVTFRSVGQKLKWNRNSGTILELAESNGIFLPSGCRAGNCGTCATPLLHGEVTSLTKPAAHVDQGSCLVCISVPKEDVEFA